MATNNNKNKEAELKAKKALATKKAKEVKKAKAIEAKKATADKKAKAKKALATKKAKDSKAKKTAAAKANTEKKAKAIKAKKVTIEKKTKASKAATPKKAKASKAAAPKKAKASKAATPKKAKIHKIYITVRKTKDHEIKGWFIVDKKAPVDYKFDSKRKALDYVRENYSDVTVLVQNDQAKFQYTIVLKAKKVVSFVTRAKVESDDTRSTTEDVEQAFKYTHDATKEVTIENEVLPVVWLTVIVLTLLISAGLAIAAIIIAA